MTEQLHFWKVRNRQMENNNVQEVVHGFKVFRPDWTCSPNGNTKQYTCPGKFEEEGELDICGHGMHFCENAADCFNYYDFDSNNKVAEVIAYGTVLKEGDKSCTDKLEIVREIPWDEVLRIVNTGKNCTGRCNTGDWNTGDCNTGDWNTGNRNTGNRNTGDWNTGDWNKSSFNTGCFMTEEQKIMFFNKPSDWTYNDWLRSDARYLLNRIPKNVVEWIYSEDMTDEEKAEHPTHETTGGYLKVLDESDCGQLWWGSLSDRQKNIIKALPNFDPEIFYQCTGINVNE
nr:MAG TPA: pentapeptide repeat protein [Caudoviricetes sp.]